MPSATHTDAYCLDRPEMEYLLYGGQSGTRFTQDTPVLPDVWIQYAEQPNNPQVLLINPWQGVSESDINIPWQESTPTPTMPGTLAKQLQERLSAERGRPLWKGFSKEPVPAEIVYNQTTVFARLWFHELVRVVLPMSIWWRSKVGSPAADWILRQLADPETDVRTQAREALVSALERADPYVRRESFERSQDRVRTSAEVVFAASEPTVRAAVPPAMPRTADELLLTARQREERYVQLFVQASQPGPLAGGSEQVVQRSLDPEIVWMIRVVGTLTALARGRPEVVEWPPFTDRVELRDGERRQAFYAQLRHYYENVVDEVVALLADPVPVKDDQALVFSVNRCRPARLAISRSRSSVKADAATRLFNISCRDINWAVVDSGLDATHPAFLSRETLRSRVIATYDFSFFRELLREGQQRPAARAKAAAPNRRLKRLHALLDAEPEKEKQLRSSLLSGRELDWNLLTPFITIEHKPGAYRAPIQEHGSHVAGIIGADCPDVTAGDGELYRGMCPEIRLYDFRVLDDDGAGDEFNVMAALQFIRHLNAQRDVSLIHGVNLSLSIPHDVANYACGRTPVCEECERLVATGVVVVAAAGNEGYLRYDTGKGLRDNYQSISITDPGNAEGVITVGATHRFKPHTYGISYFSSRGPTGDGRAKPDLVAPGEKIHSAVPGAAYKPMDGTSMAAPHVSGAAALLMARHRELLGQPNRIKQILCATATDLGRERYFQGAGMVDVLRALQSV